MGAAALQPKLDCPCDGELGRPKGEGVTILKSKVGFDLALFVQAQGSGVSAQLALLHRLVTREERDIVERDHVMHDDRVDTGED